jgi:hypothetical protein
MWALFGAMSVGRVWGQPSNFKNEVTPNNENKG